MIDADGCPVVDLTVRIGRAHSVPVKILCDTAQRTPLMAQTHGRYTPNPAAVPRDAFFLFLYMVMV